MTTLKLPHELTLKTSKVFNDINEASNRGCVLKYIGNDQYTQILDTAKDLTIGSIRFIIYKGGEVTKFSYKTEMPYLDFNTKTVPETLREYLNLPSETGPIYEYNEIEPPSEENPEGVYEEILIEESKPLTYLFKDIFTFVEYLNEDGNLVDKDGKLIRVVSEDDNVETTDDTIYEIEKVRFINSVNSNLLPMSLTCTLLETMEELKLVEERKYIDSLTMSQRELILAMVQLGYNYEETLKPILDSNPLIYASFWGSSAILRGDPLIVQFAEQLKIPSDLIDTAFLEVEKLKVELATL